MLTRPFLFVDFDLANESRELLTDLTKESFQLLAVALGFHKHPSISEILHEPGHRKACRNGLHLGPETHPLHVTLKINTQHLDALPCHSPATCPILILSTSQERLCHGIGVDFSPTVSHTFLIPTGCSMSEYFDFFGEGDWDDRSEVGWSEGTWRRYLSSHREEVTRFQSIYNTLKDTPNHIDEVAHLMGWDQQEWTATDFDLGEDGSPNQDESDDSDDDGFEPYTLHRHPVYIFTHGLYGQLKEGWENLINQAGSQLPVAMVWRFGKSLHEGELQAVMALQAQDLGDFALTVCHMKHALAAINESLRVLQELPATQNAIVELFRADTLVRLFDLREVWLRVMGDCRQEMRQRPDSDQG